MILEHPEKVTEILQADKHQEKPKKPAEKKPQIPSQQAPLQPAVQKPTQQPPTHSQQKEKDKEPPPLQFQKSQKKGFFGERGLSLGLGNILRGQDSEALTGAAQSLLTSAFSKIPFGSQSKSSATPTEFVPLSSVFLHAPSSLTAACNITQLGRPGVCANIG